MTDRIFSDVRDRLVIHGISAEAWARRYDIEPCSAPCQDCGVMRTTTVPFACGQLRGLMAPKCECGQEGVPYCLVRDPRHGDLFTGGGP